MTGDHHREGSSYLQGLWLSLLYKELERKPNIDKD